MPIRLWNRVTREAVDVPEDQVDGLLRSGKFVPGEGDVFPMIIGESARLVHSDNMIPALQSGARMPANVDEWKLATDMAKGASVPGAVLFGQRAVSTALFGVPDILANPEQQAAIKFAKEAQPGTAMAGSVAGALLPGLGTAAAGLGKAAASLAVGTSKGLAGKVLGLGVQGAVEGGLFGMGEGVSRYGLGEEEDLVESVLSTGAVGSLVGFGVGAGAGVAGYLVGGAGKMFKRQADGIAKEVATKNREVDILFDAAGFNAAERRAAREHAGQLIEEAKFAVHPDDGLPIIHERFAKPEQIAQRFKDVIRSAGHEIDSMQQEVLEIVKATVPEDKLANALIGSQQEMAAEIRSAMSGLAPADVANRKAFQNALEVLEKPFQSADDIWKNRMYYQDMGQYDDMGHVMPNVHSTRALRNIYDKHFDQIAQGVWGDAKIAQSKMGNQVSKFEKYQELKRTYSQLADLNKKAFSKVIERAGMKKPGGAAGKILGWGLVGDVLMGGGVDKIAYVGTLAAHLLKDTLPKKMAAARAWSAFSARSSAKVQEAITAASARRASAIGRFVTGSKIGAATKVAIPLFGVDDIPTGDVKRDTANRIQALNKLLSDPTQVGDRLAGNIGEELEALDPMLAGGLAEKGVQILSHLVQTAPVPSAYGNVAQPQLQSDWTPSTFEAVKWNWRVEAALDPNSVWEKLAEGRLTVEEARTFEELYPKSYAAGTQALLAATTATSRQLSHDQLRQLSILLGQPLTADERPDAILRNQAARAKDKEAAQRNRSRQPQQSRLARLMATEAQGRVANT